jgi:hypothetical protein
MDFFAKTQICSNLSAAKYIAADRNLLRKVNPRCRIVNIVGNTDDIDKQLIWVLLDVCSVDEIKIARDQFLQQQPQKPQINAVIPQNKSNNSSSEKKNSKKKTNIKTSNGKTSKANLFKRLQSYITTG